MKKLIILLIMLFSFANVQASQIKQLVFFGDSLSDNGRLYKLLFKLVPKSPPYFKGRFSNGYTWAEHLGNYYYNKYYIDYQIYAYGGATAIFRVSSKFISPSTLELEINEYLIDALGTDKSNVMYAIWIGANDYLFADSSNPDTATQQVVDQIQKSVIRLIKSGATHFLLLNLPDLSRTPLATQNGAGKLQILSFLHNQKLDTAIAAIQKTYPQVKITLFNMYNLFNDVMKNPGKYNKKYHINITNLTQACWQNNLIGMDSNPSLEDQIRKAFNAQSPNQVDQEKISAINHYIMETPELAYTYAMGQSYLKGGIPCANANEYLFWDQLHPSAMIHRVLSQILIEQTSPIMV